MVAVEEQQCEYVGQAYRIQSRDDDILVWRPLGDNKSWNCFPPRSPPMVVNVIVEVVEIGAII